MQYFHLMLNLVIIFITSDFSLAFPLFNECIDLCGSSQLAKLTLSDYEEEVCRRGCTFYHFDSCSDEIRASPSDADSTLYHCKLKCGISCLDQYAQITESSLCTQGCELIGNYHKDLVKEAFQRARELQKVFATPEKDKDIDVDMLSDPSMKNQIYTESGNYKIPETHIRTMPIDKMKEDKKKDSGDWLDCASRNSGIPRWILLTAILSAVLIAVWLCFATEKKNSKDQEIDKTPILEDESMKDNSVVEDPPMIISDHIHFIPPPPYDAETECVLKKV